MCESCFRNGIRTRCMHGTCSFQHVLAQCCKNFQTCTSGSMQNKATKLLLRQRNFGIRSDQMLRGLTHSLAYTLTHSLTHSLMYVRTFFVSAIHICACSTAIFTGLFVPTRDCKCCFSTEQNCLRTRRKLSSWPNVRGCERGYTRSEHRMGERRWQCIGCLL